MAPRIALIGFMLESNAFAPVADEAEFVPGQHRGDDDPHTGEQDDAARNDECDAESAATLEPTP